MSIVFGTPTTLSPFRCNSSAIFSVPSPPITIRASSPNSFALRITSSETSRTVDTSFSRNLYLNGSPRLVVPRIVPPRGRIPITSLRERTRSFSCGQSRPSKPSSMPRTFHPYFMMAQFTAARITAFKPGQSPPPVQIPIVSGCSAMPFPLTSSTNFLNGERQQQPGYSRRLPSPLR